MLRPLSLSKSETRVISTSQAPSGVSAASPKLEIWEIKKEQKKKSSIPDPDLVQNFTLNSCSEFSPLLSSELLSSGISCYFTDFSLLLTSQILPGQALITSICLSLADLEDFWACPVPLLTSGAGLTLKPSASRWPTVWAVDQTRLLPVRREL